MIRLPQVALTGALILVAVHTAAEEDEEALIFGARSSVEGQLEEDRQTVDTGQRLPAIDRSLEGWNTWKKDLKEDHGLVLGMDYNTLYQSASDSLTDEDDAWSGAFRLYGRWAIHNRGENNTGFFSFKVEHRHALGDKLPPKFLGSQFGYVSVTDVVYSDDGAILSDLNYQQRLGENDQAHVIVGRFDPNSYMDVLGYTNPWTTFSNLNISLNTSIALPDYSWGVAAGSWLGQSEQWYISGSANDANGNIRTDIEFFEGGAEFFKNIEIGWSPQRNRRWHTNAHLTLWHVDEREDAGVPSSHGWSFGANKTWDDTWMAFVRAGASSGHAPLYNKSVTIGTGRTIHSTSDRLAFAINWGEPADSTLNNEIGAELFYRFQLSNGLQMTPSIQYIKDPARNPEHTSVTVLGIRFRFVI